MTRQPKPVWLRRRLPSSGQRGVVTGLIDDLCLHTVCQEAQCPNQMECFGRGTATFLLLGPSCTRRCTFCAVDKHPPATPDPAEPGRIGRAVARLGLDFCVLTMTSRDDLADGGAEHVAQSIAAVRRERPGTGVEVLISDLDGEEEALGRVLTARPEVLNHNIETVARLYPQVRPQADYGRSLNLLTRADAYRPRPVTKSGLMLGLGESRDEILKTLDDLREAGCDLITLGQYLAPSQQHHPIARFVPPEEFEAFQAEAYERGFLGVASNPLVRSSYQADRLYYRVIEQKTG